MAPIVAIIGVGAMGSAVARRLIEHGCKVITVVDGRSPESAHRALEAGMISVPLEQVTQATFLLSIVPPAVARSVAELFEAALADAPVKPVYVDCNAVSPKTAKAIAAVIDRAGCPFVDAGIIGPPPGDTGRTVFYASGAAAARFAELAAYGLNVQVLDSPVGAASALKMAFAGMTKGVTAINTAMILAATRAGAARALHAELAASRPEVLEWAQLQVTKMFPKAYRWVGEMEEIAEFSEDPATRQIYLGMARLYEQIAGDVQGPNQQTRALEEFLAIRQ